MKNFLNVAVATLLVLVSCSTEDTNYTVDQVESVDLASDLYQDSNTGIYNGVFTTLDGEQRGSVEITVPADNSRNANATIALSNGEVISLLTDDLIEKNVLTQNVTFGAGATSFMFSVDGDGKNPTVNNMILNNVEGEILVKKHTNRAPVVPIIGTFACTDCTGHPILGTGATQTFNLLMFSTPNGNSTFDTQTTLGMNVYNGAGLQDNCIPNGTETTCDLSGSYTVPGGEITWSGAHVFNNEDTLDGNDCSSVGGVWTFDSNLFGTLSGTFTNDITCNAPSILLFEDFEDTNLTYSTSIPEFTDGFGDFFIRTDGSQIGTFYNIDNVQGSSWFAAMDLDGEGAESEQTLTFSGIDVSSADIITFSGLFAEDDDGPNQDWDASDFFIVEYSFTGGADSFVPIFAIESEIPSGSNGIPRVDVNFDGVGEGDEITNVMTEYSAMFQNNATTNPTGSSTLIIRFTMGLNSGDEDISFDNITLTGITE